MCLLRIVREILYRRDFYKNLSTQFIFALNRTQITGILREDLHAFKICRRLRDKNEKYAIVREVKESV